MRKETGQVLWSSIFSQSKKISESTSDEYFDLEEGAYMFLNLLDGI